MSSAGPLGRRPRRIVDALLLAALVVLASAVCFRNLGGSSIFADEATYAHVAKGIVETGEWLRPTYHGQLFYWKPPLSIWAEALAFEIFGSSEWAARVLSAALGVATVALTFAFGRSFFGRWVGAGAALILIGSHGFVLEHGMRFGGMDAELTTLLTSCVFLVAWKFLKRPRSTGLVVLAGLALGVGLLVKSLVVLVVLPALLLFPKLALPVFERRSAYRDVAIVALVASVVYLPWFAWVNWQTGYAYLDFMWADLVVRAIHGVDPSHVHGPLFYGKSLVRDFGAWLALIALAPILFWRARGEAARAMTCLLVWSAVAIAAFSIVRSKLEWYVYPTYPAMALVAAASFAEAARRMPQTVAIAASGAFVALLGAGAWLNVAATAESTVIDFQRFANFCRAHGPAIVWADASLRREGPGFREWNEYYLDAIPGRRWVEPGAIPRGAAGCAFLVTHDPSRFLDADALGSARLFRPRKYNDRELDLVVVELCACDAGGLFEVH